MGPYASLGIARVCVAMARFLIIIIIESSDIYLYLYMRMHICYVLFLQRVLVRACTSSSRGYI